MRDLLIAFNVQLSSAAPEWVELIPAGPIVTGRDGREWRFDDVAMSCILKVYDERGVDTPIDYEHATEIKGPEGEEAPAAGWITALEGRNGALWGRVEWTERGRARIEAKEYRYLSPVFSYTKSGREIRVLESAGLTNKPNLRLTALNRQAETPMEEEHPMKKALCKRLGLDPETATEQQIQDAVAKLQGDLATAANRAMPGELLAALGLDAAAAPDQAVAKAKELAGTASAANRAQAAGTTIDLAAFVPRADYDLALNRAATAEDAIKQRDAAELDGKIETAVNQAIRDGKIAPASKEFYVATCRAEGGLKAFETFAAAAPQVIQDPHLPDEPAQAPGTLTEAQKAICRNMGLDEKEFAKSLKEGA